ncbi:MAG: hypothetical protein AAF677_10450 [Pseudomonadota bacterium]
MPIRPVRRCRAALALFLAGLAAGCVAPQHTGQIQALHEGVANTLDRDRSKAARVAAGIGAAQVGVGLGCTMLIDGPKLSFLTPLYAFCAAR